MIAAGNTTATPPLPAGELIAPNQQWLENVDWALSGLAVLAAAWWWMTVVARRARDPLAESPVRVHLLDEAALAVGLAVFLLVGVGLSWGLAGLGAEAETPLAILAVGNGAQLAGLLVCLIIAERRYAGGMKAFLLGDEAQRYRLAASTFMATILAMGLCPLILRGSLLLLELLQPQFVPTSHPTIDALESGGGLGLIALLWIGAAVVAPLAEEVYFRGFGQSVVVRLTGSRWMAILLVSLVFGLVHARQLHAVPALVVLGVILGYAYERSGSLLPPIAAHAMFNLKTLIWHALGGPPG